MRIGIQITKSVLFRGVQQEFHNIYHFNLATAVTAPSENLVDELVTKERTLHAASVAFRRAAVWSAGGTKAQNQMLFQKNLSGTGNETNAASMDRERAILIRWPAGFDSRGMPVYLRKWYHVCGQIGAHAIAASGILANEIGLTDGQRSGIAGIADGVRNIGTGDFWSLVGPGGRETTGAAQCHKYLEHHQMGDAWR